MPTPVNALPDTADMIRELCDTTTHRERLEHRHHNRDGTTTTITSWHTTRYPPLLQQLADAIEPSSATEDGQRPGFGSKPSARLDAIVAHLMIDHEAARWVRDLGQDDTGDTITCVRRAAALGRHNPKVKRSIRRWWITARVVTGWDTPAWQPDATCPLCGKRGTLRIRLATQTGLCLPDTGCGEVWDPTTIGLLADHIRAETETIKPTQPIELDHRRAEFLAKVAKVDQLRASLRSAPEVCPDPGEPPDVLRGLLG